MSMMNQKLNENKSAVKLPITESREEIKGEQVDTQMSQVQTKLMETDPQYATSQAEVEKEVATMPVGDPQMPILTQEEDPGPKIDEAIQSLERSEPPEFDAQIMPIKELPK